MRGTQPGASLPRRPSPAPTVERSGLGLVFGVECPRPSTSHKGDLSERRHAQRRPTSDQGYHPRKVTHAVSVHVSVSLSESQSMKAKCIIPSVQ